MSIFTGNPTCPACGAGVKKGANYCPSCGSALSEGKIICGVCRQAIPADSKFCPFCGQAVAAAAAPLMDANHWHKGEEDFAVRIELDDLPGYLRRQLIVEPGARAIMLVDGANQGALPPGKYSFDDIGRKLNAALNLGSARQAAAILIDDGPCDLQFDVPELFTADPMRIGFTCRLVLRLNPAGEAPFQFMNALLKSRRRLSLADLRGYLFPEIRSAAQAWFGRRRIEDLHDDPRLKDRLAQELEMALESTFGRSGLLFEDLRAFDLAHEQYDQVRDVREKYYLEQQSLAAEAGRIETARQELAQRQLLFEVFDEEQRQEIEEETQKVAHFEKRARVWADMRQAVLSDRMDELEGEDKMEAFLRRRDREKLVAEEEWAELKRTYREAAEDHDRARAHLLARLDLEEQSELKRKELALRAGYTTAAFEEEQTRLRRELALEQELEQQRWLHRIKLRRQEAAVRRSEEALEDLARRERQLQDEQQRLELARQQAQTGAEIRAIEREEDRLDAELGLTIQSRMRADKLAHQEQAQLLALRQQRAELEMTLAAEERRARLQLAQERQREELAQAARQAEYDFELNRIERLAGLSAEAIVSLSDAPQAQVIASLKRTEALAQMEPEAILAMAAEKAPEVAQAFAEKYRAMARGEMSEQEKALFERLLAQKDDSAAALLKALEESARRESDTARRAMDSAVEVAKEFARTGSQPPAVIYPSPGAAGAPPAVAAAGLVQQGGEVVLCPNCHVRSQTGTKYCQNCGHQFFE